MGERFRQAIEKEKRLEVASRPIQKKRQEPVQDEDEAKADKAANKKRKLMDKKTDVKVRKLDEGALVQQDTLEEGINWSDDEE
jgi:hypothetical protein